MHIIGQIYTHSKDTKRIQNVVQKKEERHVQYVDENRIEKIHNEEKKMLLNKESPPKRKLRN